MAALTVEGARQIYSAEETQGKCLLSSLMHLGPYLEERNLQRAVQVDFFYDQLVFAAKKGFPWDQVCIVVQFAAEFLATSTDRSITDAVSLYRAQSLNLLLELGERNYKFYTDFLFSTFFTHFQLYKYIMSHPREEIIPQLHVDVEAPVPPPRLAEAKEETVWNYEQKMEKLKTIEFEILRHHLVHQEIKETEVAATKEHVIKKVEEAPTPFTKTSLGEMLQSLMADYVRVTADSLSNTISEVHQDLDIKLQKTALPRPAVLGPPPRYRPRTPIQPLPKAPMSTSVNKGDRKGGNRNQNNSNTNEKPKSPKSVKSSSARSRSSGSRASKR